MITLVNEALRPLFLDLKEGAIVVSLKPFVQDNQRLNSRNVRFSIAADFVLLTDAYDRSTTLAPYLLLPRASTILAAFRGATVEGNITCTPSIVKDIPMTRSDSRLQLKDAGLLDEHS